MLPRSPRFDRVITSAAPKLATRVDVLYNRQVVLGGDTSIGLAAESFEVTYDRTAAILARGALTGVEPTRLPTLDAGGVMSPFGYEIQPWRGLRYADGDLELIPLGVFPIQKATFDGATLKGDIELLDRAKLVQDAKFEQDYVIAAGTNTATAIQAMIDNGVPGLTYAFQSTSFTTPAWVLSAGDDRWEAARLLAKSIGCEVFFDRYGRCVLRPEPGASADPVFTVTGGDGGNLTAITLDLDREPAFNRVIVTGENSGNSEVYRGVATDDDPGSPTYYDGPFGRKTFFYADDAITSNDQAAVAAQAILAAKSGVARSLSLTCLPNPAWEAGDVGSVTHDGLAVDELYILDGFTISGEAGALMGMGGIDITSPASMTSMAVNARFVGTVAVTSDTPVDPTDPDDPTFTGLTVEQFDGGGIDGQAPTTSNTSAVAVTGSGTLTLSDEFVLTGGLGLKIDGTAQHYLTFAVDASTDYPSHPQHFISAYYEHTRNPSADAYYIAVRDGTDAATAFQIGIDTTGHLIIRDGDSGGVDDTANFAFASGNTYRIDVSAGASLLTVRIYAGTDLNSDDTGDATDTLSCALTATTFSNDRLGLLVTIAGTGTAVGNLQNATFESGSNGDALTTTNTGADVVSGTSGNCKISTAHPQNGTRGMRIGCGLTDPAYNSARYDNASHTNHYVSFFLYIVAAGSGNTIIYELRNGAGTQTGTQLVVNSSRALVLRNAFGAVATSAALTANTMYRVDITYLGAGDQTLRYYTGVNLLSTNTANAVATLTGALTDTNFSNDLLGVIGNATGTPDIFIDDFRSDSAALPVGTVAVGPGGYLDRYLSDSGTMPGPLEGDVDPPPPDTTGILVPTSGIYIGATTGNVGAQSSSNAAGMATYLDITGGVRPHIVHVFITARNWSGIPTTMERNLFRPAGQAPAIPNWTWKPGGNDENALTWRQIANGANDSGLRGAARGLKQYGRQQFLSFQNEADLKVNATNTTADYKAMVRHCIDVFHDEGVTREHVLFVYKMGGYSGKAGTNGANHNAMYPGDDYIDWLAYDPYWDATIRTGLAAPYGLINEDIAGVWDGFYAWGTTPSAYTDGSKPIMINEYGPNFNDLTDSQAATRMQQLIDGIEDYPRVKALIYWNSTVSAGIDAQMYGHPLTIAKYHALVRLPYTQQTIA